MNEIFEYTSSLQLKYNNATLEILYFFDLETIWNNMKPLETLPYCNILCIMHRPLSLTCNYSYRKLSTGFRFAALQVCEKTVITPMIKRKRIPVIK